MKRSLSASAIQTAYIDDATKRAILGSGWAHSFGLPLSAAVTFKPSALEDGPVELVPAVTDGLILPFAIICFTGDTLKADVSGNFGWPAPPPPEGEDPEQPSQHDEPWLTSTPTVAFGGEEHGSLVTLPNGTALVGGRLWPECVVNRPFALELAAGAARSSKKSKRGARSAEEEEAIKAEREASARAGEEEEPEGEVTIVVFYTVG